MLSTVVIVYDSANCNALNTVTVTILAHPVECDDQRNRGSRLSLRELT